MRINRDLDTRWTWYYCKKELQEIIQAHEWSIDFNREDYKKVLEDWNERCRVGDMSVPPKSGNQYCM